MQWASAHIHLAQKHSHYEANLTELDHHTHNLTTHYTAAANLSHLNDASATVDLDNQFNQTTGKNKTPNFALISGSLPLPTSKQTVRLAQSFSHSFFYQRLDPSAANPRAPPNFS